MCMRGSTEETEYKIVVGEIHHIVLGPFKNAISVGVVLPWAFISKIYCFNANDYCSFIVVSLLVSAIQC